MPLKAQIDQDIKEAMKAKDQGALRALRAIKSAILVAETAEGHTGELSEADESKIIQKQVKQRRDSIKEFRDNNRADLAEKEEEELVVIERYLPQQLSLEAVTAAVQAIITEVGATSMKEMGKVMGLASKKLAGQAENSVISDVVKKLLS
ncbi:MAG: GatB/YqeY domain-containing protein [Bacteroidetes bacterium]|nr:MAG: GatB/YqeY domain-containing protein [Bacteroidota bacterium]